MTQKRDLTLHFPEGSHSQRVAEDVMADFYPSFVFLLLPLCHLLRYRRLGWLGAAGVLPACLRSAGRGGALHRSPCERSRGAAAATTPPRKTRTVRFMVNTEAEICDCFLEAIWHLCGITGIISPRTTYPTL